MLIHTVGVVYQYNTERESTVEFIKTNTVWFSFLPYCQHGKKF